MIKVNKKQCIGCGLCASICPQVFAMDEDYKAEVISMDDVKCAKQASTNCPVNAIIVS